MIIFPHINHLTAKSKPLNLLIKKIQSPVPILFTGEDRFELSTTVAVSSPRERRIQLYSDFSKKSVPKGEEKKEVSQYNGGGFSERSGSMQGRHERKKDTPEIIKAKLEKRSLVTLPEGYALNFKKNPRKKSPYQLPTAQGLIKKLLTGKAFKLTIPIVQQSNINIPVPEINPYMDMTTGSIAYNMVDSKVQPSEIAEAYQANWSVEKTCRDILQNFSDGHGQTLEGVSFEVQKVLPQKPLLSTIKSLFFDSPSSEPTLYRVKIRGQAQYDYEKAYVLGASGADEEDSGEYGEGLKMIPLNLLRDYGASSVKMSSANWAMTYTLPEGQEEEGHTSKLYNQLEHIADPAKQPAGNYLEFETSNLDFIEALFKATNYFRHPYNPDFQEQSYENDIGGFKILGSEKKGNLYISNQRFEYENHGAWENEVPGLSVWKNVKSKDAKVDRDRNPISPSEVSKLLDKIVSNMDKKEIVSLINTLKASWRSDFVATGSLLISLHSKLAYKHEAKMTFPPQYLADNLMSISDRLNISTFKAESDLKRKGFILCPQDIGRIGMTLASDALIELDPNAISTDEKTKKPYEMLTAKAVKDIVEIVKEANEEKLKITQQETVRFHVLESFLQGISLQLKDSQFYKLETTETGSLNLLLGKENSQEVTLDYDSCETVSTFQVSPETLKNRRLEQALLETISPIILENKNQDHSSTEYTNDLTELSMELSKILLSSKELQKTYADLKAVWELSWQDEGITQQLLSQQTGE